MHLAVFEFLCGGGLAASPDPSTDGVELRSLFQEGLGMLRCLIEDLVGCGHQITTVIDPRSVDTTSLSRIREIAEVHFVGERESHSLGFLPHWIQASRGVQRVLIIAPEIDGILQRLTRSMQESGVPLWGASDQFLDQASDKLALSKSIPSISRHPQTWNARDWFALAQRGGLPLVPPSEEGWVLKDRYGAGCSDMRWFDSTDSLLRWIERSNCDASSRLGLEGNWEHWIVQRWIPGIPASLSLIAFPDQPAMLVGCMGQMISRDGEVRYSGGFGPLLEEQSGRLQEWAREIIAQYTGVCGWFGMDVILRPLRIEHAPLPDANDIERVREVLQSPFELHLIEINPRLTTSYLGWRDLIGPSLSEGVLGISPSWASCKRNEKRVTFRVVS